MRSAAGKRVWTYARDHKISKSLGIQLGFWKSETLMRDNDCTNITEEDENKFEVASRIDSFPDELKREVAAFYTDAGHTLDITITSPGASATDPVSFPGRLY